MFFGLCPFVEVVLLPHYNAFRTANSVSVKEKKKE